LRKLIAAAIAMPTIALVYLGSITRRSNVVRFGAGVMIATVVGIGTLATNGTPQTVATPPSIPVPLTAAAFTTAVRTGLELDAPVAVEFTTPMDEASVAASVRVEPATDVDLAWDSAGRTLTITPADAWLPDTLHRLVVEPGALARTGRPLARPVRAAFLTRAATTGQIAATATAGTLARIDSAFAITFSRRVVVDSVTSGLQIEPPLAGMVVPDEWMPDGMHYTFRPTERLRPGVTYQFTLGGVRTADGETLDELTLSVETPNVPAVVRYRPRAKTSDAPRGAAISVRFTETMDRTTTAQAFTVKVNGKAIKGGIRFAEKDTVLVFTPASALPYDAKVVARVAETATSAAGTPMAKASSGAFSTESRPAPPPKAPAATTPPSSGGGGGGSSAGSGSWTAVERYYLGLMNCTRTGGWVSSSGSCSSPGGRNVAPLKLDAGISSKVARPYAKLLATRGECTHFIGGNPGDRLRRAGYTSYRWAENIGCRSGDPKKAVLGSHLYFQSEKSYLGGHYVNLMDARYDRAGIGVWVSGGRVRLVVDFYHP
jgi:uncharacterized protein YkwD